VDSVGRHRHGPSAGVRGRLSTLVCPPMPAPPRVSPEHRLIIYAADRFRCAYCGSRWYLQIDHVRPRAHGGRDRLRNYVTLCRVCNKIKADYWREADHFTCYHAFAGFNDRRQAARILRRERWVRRNPLRWLRLGRALLKERHS
jgi:HNH endonuclease